MLALGDEGLEHLAFVIHLPLQIMCLAFELHAYPITVPAPLEIKSALADAPFSDLRCEDRTNGWSVALFPQAANLCARSERPDWGEARHRGCG